MIYTNKPLQWQEGITAPRDGTEFQAWLVTSDGSGHLGEKCRFDERGILGVWDRLGEESWGFDYGLGHLRLSAWIPLPSEPEEQDIELEFPVSRKGDMSPDGHLTIARDGCGDLIVAVYQGDQDGGIEEMASVEFCTPIIGGGQSPNVVKALQELAIAMQKDNLERPGRNVTPEDKPRGSLSD